MNRKYYIKKFNNKYIATIYTYDEEILVDIETKVLESVNRKDALVEAEKIYDHEFIMVFPSEIQ